MGIDPSRDSVDEIEDKCAAGGFVFIDEAFPPVMSSLVPQSTYSEARSESLIAWKRPG